MKRHRLETQDDHRAQIARGAREAFAEHVLTEEAPGQWLCAKPGTGIYHFRVAQLKGALVVWGDIGDLIIANGRGTVAWFRGAQRDRDYVLSKSPTARRGEFLPGEFKLALFHHDRKHLRELEAEGSLFDEGDWMSWLEDGGDSECRVHDWTSNDHWCCEALARFVELLDAPAEGGVA